MGEEGRVSTRGEEMKKREMLLCACTCHALCELRRRVARDLRPLAAMTDALVEGRNVAVGKRPLVREHLPDEGAKSEDLRPMAVWL